MAPQEQGILSIVTATYNSAAELPRLVASLRAQTDQEFEWVVADGGSTDTTLEQLRALTDIDIKLSSQPDFGIYDALNRALKMASGAYYIVVGADDELHANTVAQYRAAIERHPADVIVAYVMYGPHCFKVKRGPVWLVADKAFIAHHSLGTALRRSLHARFGLYSRRLPIAADSLFILQACLGGATRYQAGFIAGRVGRDGVSYVDWVGSATELFRAQLMTGRALWLQVLVLMLRIIKGSSVSVRALHNALFR